MEMIDWNNKTIEQYIEHLEDKFRFDSSGTAKAVYELIAAYRAKNCNKPAVMPRLSKELVLKILDKRHKDAFANQYHRHEYARLQEAIDTIEALVPPSYFTNEA